MKTATRTRKLPVRPVPAICFLAQPGARLLLINDHAHMVAGDEHKRINNPTVDALIELGYISNARQLDTDILTYSITPLGVAIAEQFEALKRNYYQLPLPQLAPGSQEEQPTASAPTFSHPQEQEASAPIESEPTTCSQEEQAARNRPQQERPAKRKRLTPEEAKAERAAKRAQIKQNVQNGIAALCAEVRNGKSTRLLEYLSFASRFPKYSLNNQFLILSQKPNATRVAGYTTWQKMGYHVRKGEKGIAILTPRPFSKTKLDKESGEETIIQCCAFSVGYVFDQSQLEPNPEKPLPDFFAPLADDQEQLYQWIATAVRADGITLEIGPTGQAQGYSAGGCIRLRGGLDSTSRVLTLIHEWAHERLHQTPNGRAIPTGKKECHAEAISYIVAHHFNVHNTFASGYLQNWGNTEQEIQAELEIIRATASAMIERIEELAQAYPAPTDPPATTAPAQYPSCVCCGEPAPNAQEINSQTVCTACIDQETANLSPEDCEPPAQPDREPQPPTPAPQGESSPTPAHDQAPTPQQVETSPASMPPAPAMPYKNEPVPAYVLEVLRDGVEIDGDRLRIVQKLERTLYEAVNKTLERIGGRWNRKAKAHLFEDGNPRDLLNFVLATGMIPPKNPTAYYPASEELAARIARYIPATARRVLEPSAGTGSIARAIREYCHRQHIPAALDCCEILPKFQEQLQAQGFNVIWSDFLTYRPSSIYDAILMNPPYALESDRLAYITHIEHAWSLLAPGGVLVAVAPAGFAHNIERRVKALRDLIATCGYWEDLPDGTFREAGTMVRTVLLVAHKPRPVQGDDHAPQCQEIPIVSEAESISASQDPETGAAQGEASPAPFDMSAPTGTQDPASQQESAERPAQEAQKPAPAERKRARETHTVMLGWQSYGVTVGAETYQHILSLLKEQAVCRRCQCCYTANSPQVAGNLCLDCFLRREGRQHGLSYVGKAKTHEADPWTTHLYLDPRNRIYTSTAGPGKAEEAQEDAFETLRYWKFPIPEHATINGKTVDVHKGTQSIYGDVTGDIIAIRCTNRHEDTDITFFASKSGMLRQINMRKPAHRKLFAEAKRRLEIQKRTRHFYESEVCETIIEMLCGNPALWP